GELRPTVERLEAETPDLGTYTTFELTLALALLHFRAEAVDAVVLETGLGGRLDATNVVDPLVTTVTSLSLDHTHILGGTLAEIAAEKAGIFKRGVPAVSAPQPPEAAAVLIERAEQVGAPLLLGVRDWHVSGDHRDAGVIGPD